MEPILNLHRRETDQADSGHFLGHFPQSFIQYFDDAPTRDPRKALSTPHLRESQAKAKQREGCGVYVSPNAFVGARRKECLRRIQAIFLDIDAGKEGDSQGIEMLEHRKTDALLSLLASPCPPHAITETKHGLQPLWRVSPLDVEEGLILFREAIKILLRRFDADPAAKDPVRPIRMPGFLHLKNPSDPFLCRLLWNNLDREPVSLRSIIDELYIPPPSPSKRSFFLSPRPKMFSSPDIAEVIRAAAREAGIDVTLRRNRDGSRQIIENGEVTSGFISGRGNFCYSASGKSRKGGPLQLARFYLGLDRESAKQWLDERFGFPKPMPKARRNAPRVLSGDQGFSQGRAPIGSPANSLDCLARGQRPAMDIPASPHIS